MIITAALSSPAMARAPETAPRTWLDVTLVFILIGPGVGALAALLFGVSYGADGLRFGHLLDAAGVLLFMSYTVGIVPAAAAGSLMGALSPRIEALFGWAMAGALIGGLVAGAACLAVIVAAETAVNGSRDVPSYVLGEVLFSLIIAAHGAAAGAVSALISRNRRPKPVRRRPEIAASL